MSKRVLIFGILEKKIFCLKGQCLSFSFELSHFLLGRFFWVKLSKFCDIKKKVEKSTFLYQLPWLKNHMYITITTILIIKCKKGSNYLSNGTLNISVSWYFGGKIDNLKKLVDFYQTYPTTRLTPRYPTCWKICYL